MAQQPAYTNDEIIAAGRALRARGAEPTRPVLWAELGRRGQPQTAWGVWQAFRDKEFSSAPVTTGALGVETSPEMDEKKRAHQSTLSALLNQVRREAAEPLERELATLRAALRREASERDDLMALVDDMQAELASRDERIASLLRGDTPSARLILP